MSAKTTQVGGSHYKGLKIQPVEYIHGNGLGFCEGSVVKYVTRWRDKGGIDDLRKARHFIELLIEMETATHADMTPSFWDESRMDNIGRNGNEGEHYAATEQIRQIDEALDAMHHDPRTMIDCGGASFEESADFDPAPDMTDPRNWRAGDWVECLDDSPSFTKGLIYRIKKPVSDYGNLGICFDDKGSQNNGKAHKFFRFHARPDADGWIKWEGGERPSNSAQKVEHRMRDGGISIAEFQELRWTHMEYPGDIVAYRPIAPSADKG